MLDLGLSSLPAGVCKSQEWKGWQKKGRLILGAVRWGPGAGRPSVHVLPSVAAGWATGSTRHWGCLLLSEAMRHDREGNKQGPSLYLGEQEQSQPRFNSVIVKPRFI